MLLCYVANLIATCNYTITWHNLHKHYYNTEFARCNLLLQIIKMSLHKGKVKYAKKDHV